MRNIGRPVGITHKISYVLIGLISVSLAFFVSLKFIGKLKAQTPSGTNAPVTDIATPPGATTATPAPTATTATPPAPPTGEIAPSTSPAAGSAQAPTGSPASSGIAELEGFLEPFIYDTNSRRDPFAPYAEYAPEEGPSRPMSLAQRFDLDQLKLIGIMWDVKEPKAMFADPENSVMILGRDESIGNRNGYIAAIREGEVVVVEATNRKGDVLYRTRVLRIQR